MGCDRWGLLLSLRLSSISIHAPRVGCDSCWVSRVSQAVGISIHAPRVGCDGAYVVLTAPLWYFNPRTPCGVRPGGCPGAVIRWPDFNPRTPCGVRLPALPATGATADFNPRTPCGVRLLNLNSMSLKTLNFNPRTPCGVRHTLWNFREYGLCISIHAPRVGCDPTENVYRARDTHFNPRTPCGVRPLV